MCAAVKKPIEFGVTVVIVYDAPVVEVETLTTARTTFPVAEVVTGGTSLSPLSRMVSKLITWFLTGMVYSIGPLVPGAPLCKWAPVKKPSEFFDRTVALMTRPPSTERSIVAVPVVAEVTGGTTLLPARVVLYPPLEIA